MTSPVQALTCSTVILLAKQNSCFKSMDGETVSGSSAIMQNLRQETFWLHLIAEYVVYVSNCQAVVLSFCVSFVCVCVCLLSPDHTWGHPRPFLWHNRNPRFSYPGCLCCLLLVWGQGGIAMQNRGAPIVSRTP